MGFIRNKITQILGYRWSLYVLEDKTKLLLAMHSDNGLQLIEYVGGILVDNGDLPLPYSFSMNFNRKHKVIHISKSDFDKTGRLNVYLFERMFDIDKDFHIKPWVSPLNFIYVSTNEIMEPDTILNILYKQ